MIYCLSSFAIVGCLRKKRTEALRGESLVLYRGSLGLLQ